MSNRRLPLVTASMSVLAAACLFVAACSSAQDSLESTSTSQSTTTVEIADTSTTSTAVVASPTIEATPTGVRDVVVAWFNEESVIDEETYETLFAPLFKDQVSFADVTPVIEQLAQSGPWELDEVLSETDATGSYRLRNATGDLAVLDVSIDSDQLVDGLFVGPWTPEVRSLEEAQEQIAAYETSTLLVAEVTSGECVPVAESNAGQIHPLGSVFKLYVLGALVDAINDGSVAWDQNVTIRDELDSFPSGTTQDVEAGTELTVRELAELMISISDNTATDHLIDLLGRETVEDAQAAYGHSNPDLNRPFPTTRELFLLKTNAELLEQYLAADQTERRAILDSSIETALPPLSEAMEFFGDEPIAIDVVEWFATPNDVCRLLVELAKNTEAKRILSENPGIPDDSGRWTYIGFKGGSEPGVAAVAWFVEDTDGRSFTVTGGVTGDQTVSAIEVVGSFAGIRDLFEPPTP